MLKQPESTEEGSAVTPALNALRHFRCTALITAFLCSGGLARGDIVYQTNFDSLTPGQTQPFPGAAGQDGWYSVLAVGDAFGEIQNSIANGGQALHEHTAATVPASLQTIDQRNLGPLSLSGIGVITLSADFYGHSSNLDTVNNFIASLGAGGGPHPGFDIISFGLGGGNGTPKSQTGLNVGLSHFNGSTNNDPIPLTVGQDLSWDSWHSISISLDQSADTWLSITVDGQSQSLLGFAPARSFDGTNWLRGQLLERLSSAIIPDDVGGDRTDDDVYFDNIKLTAQSVPEPNSVLLVGLGAVVATCIVRRR
jgi:hypothetical protein